MVGLWRATLRGNAVSLVDSVLGWSHIALGTTILLAALARLVDRVVHGRPPEPRGQPAWVEWLAKATHSLIYVILLAMPVLGLAAWFTGSRDLADYHTVLWTPLLVLIGVHIAGALAQHFAFRTDALRRMVPYWRTSSS